MSGEFFDYDNLEDFKKHFQAFHENIQNGKYDSKKIRFHALKFGKERFMEEFSEVIENAMRR
jgi:hypothetical protein